MHPPILTRLPHRDRACGEYPRYGPLLIATGPGAEERRSIAILVVGGMALSLPLTLIAVPVIYSILDDVGRMFWRERTT